MIMGRVIVLTRCPHCGKFQKTFVVMYKRCVYCGKRFTLYPKNTPARIYAIVQGTYAQYMHEVNMVVKRLNERRNRDKLRKKWLRGKKKHEEATQECDPVESKLSD